MTAKQEPAPAIPYSRAYLRYALGLLTVVYAFNFLDRQILVILQESIKKEMGLSDSALGLLSGFSFAIFYVTAGLPIAWMADRGVRRNVVAGAVTIWSLMTAVSGMARNFWQLLAARIGVGIGEAGGSPPIHAIISDYFPFAQRGRALAVYSTGIYIGVLAGYLIGGWVNQLFGWRAAFFVVGAPGLVVALLVRLTIREPQRGQSDAVVATGPPPSLRESATLIWGLRSFRWLTLAAGLTAFVTYATGNFSPSFLSRSHHLQSGEIGTALALIVGLGGITGTYLGGYLTDRLGLRDRRWYLWVPAIALTIALPLRVLAFMVGSLPLCFLLWIPTEICYTTFLAPSIAIAHAMVPAALRAFISSILFFVLNLIGLGAGPLFTGWVSDLLTPRFGPEALRWSMVITCLAWIPAVCCYLLAAGNLRKDLAHT